MMVGEVFGSANFVQFERNLLETVFCNQGPGKVFGGTLDLQLTNLAFD